MSFSSYWANPVLFAVTLYPGDGTSDGAVNTPASVVLRVRLMPLDSLATTTWAPGIAAPDASRTTPEIAPSPATDCANALPLHRMAKRTPTHLPLTLL